jgi:hypothetical protein
MKELERKPFSPIDERTAEQRLLEHQRQNWAAQFGIRTHGIEPVHAASLPASVEGAEASEARALAEEIVKNARTSPSPEGAPSWMTVRPPETVYRRQNRS